MSAPPGGPHPASLPPAHPGETPALTYRDAGVDIGRADALVAQLRALAQRTHGPQVVPFTDAYAGLYRLGPDGPLLAATCDGVGTKLLLAVELQRYRALGQDLVAMNVNDLLPCAARPLFFLDYLAAGRLDPRALTELLEGVVAACRLAGCALLGGETAEMPGLYAPGHFDVSGFAVGLADPALMPRLDGLAAGDRILALPASGVHSNGLSLARRAIERAGLPLTAQPPGLGRSLGETLLTPTPIYVDEVLAALRLAAGEVHGAAHVTGGGLLGRARKLARPGLGLRLRPESYVQPPIFEVIARAGGISEHEMASTFNMGLGFLLCVSPAGAERLLAAPASGWREVGEVVSGAEGVDLGYAAVP
jgi:phosphoribosylformylglycinamidine cyclo-ligase